MFAKAASDYITFYCCSRKTHVYIQSEDPCGKDLKDVKREDCADNEECKKTCTKFFTQSPWPTVKADEYWEQVGKLKQVRRHRGRYIHGIPFGISGRAGRRIVIGFKCTSNLHDVLADMNLVTTSFKIFTEPPTDLRAHGGFNSYYDSIRTSLIKHVNLMLKESRPDEVMIVGHSLGGAMATLCAVDIAAMFRSWRDPIKVSLWTFGAPRVFSASATTGTFSYACLFRHTRARTHTRTHRQIASACACVGPVSWSMSW